MKNVDTSFLTPRQKNLFEVIKHWHEGQTRKGTDEPYHNHPVRVAKLVYELDDVRVIAFLGVEIALVHDVLEDCEGVTFQVFAKALSNAGYSPNEAYQIYEGAEDLKKFYTPELFPELNRAARSTAESKRLVTKGFMAQTVKCADIMDNAKDIAKELPSFASVWLPEKWETLKSLNNAHLAALNKAKNVVSESIEKIKREA